MIWLNFLKKALIGYPKLHEKLLDIKYLNKPLPHNKIFQIEYGAKPDVQSIFTEIFATNFWGDDASRSGSGSNLVYTHELRKDIAKLLFELSIKSILDAPCGDFFWMSKLEIPADFDYIGGDIVADLISALESKYKSAHRKFIQLDVTKDNLPSADLWLCRDCLIHLSNAHALAALHNFARSDIKYVLTTTYNFGRLNADIETGNFRMLNLRKPPFSLPRPLKVIKDYIYPATPRSLGLWSRDQIRAWAANAPIKPDS